MAKLLTINVTLSSHFVTLQLFSTMYNVKPDGCLKNSFPKNLCKGRTANS